MLKSEPTSNIAADPAPGPAITGIQSSAGRRFPIGAEVRPGGVHFRVWAPRSRSLHVVLERGPGAAHGPREVALIVEGQGYHAGLVPGAAAGTCYRFRLDHGTSLYPDPASRFQPEGPEGPSRVEDPAAFSWTDQGWRGVRIEGQVIYEMHVGTFSPEGTWAAATNELPGLADLGITLIELLPVAEFAGSFGWGYDGVDLFAPTRLYGEPHDFRRFVDRAHALGIGVILDVVYNHLGPRGNVLPVFSEDYFSRERTTDWGEAINFDGDNAGPVREFYLTNAAYWIDELHLDGLRVDATQDIHDASDEHILAALTRRARAAAAGRDIVLIGENEPQNPWLVRAPERGGYGMDAVWNDDFHHSAMVALTGRNEAYYSDYLGCPQELLSAVKWGYLFQGQRYIWQAKARGRSALDVAPARYVNYLQNHDQIANSGRGQRCHMLTSPGRYRAMMALLLLGPGTPMLFQGQEFAASSRFCFFADHPGALAVSVSAGRKEFLSQFRSLATAEMQERLPDPGERATFLLSKLDPGERERHGEALALTRDLLRLRREDPVFRRQQPRCVDGAVLGAEALVLRFFAASDPGSQLMGQLTDQLTGEDRLLILNLGRDLHLIPAPEPLLAPPEDRCWTVLWSSEDPRYGGNGTPPLETEDGWRLPGHAAVVLAPTLVAEAAPHG